jgi:hypothetical protein
MTFKSKTDPLGLRQHDPVQRWKDDAQRREEKFAEERRHEAEEQQRRVDAIAANEAAQLRNALEARIAALEQRSADLEYNLLEGARATRYAIEEIADQLVELNRERREEIRDLRAEVAKLHSTLTELREERVRSFQGFAREKDGEVVDLPSFLPRRVN